MSHKKEYDNLESRRNSNTPKYSKYDIDELSNSISNISLNEEHKDIPFIRRSKSWGESIPQTVSTETEIEFSSNHVQVELTHEEINKVDEIFKLKTKEPIVRVGDIELTQSDLELLFKHNAWLNDECVNAYMNYLSHRSQNLTHLPRCHFFNSFFYTLLSNKGYNYQRVSRWTKSLDIFTLDKIIIPIHRGFHWTLFVVNIKQKQLEYYDSFGGKNEECFTRIKRYLVDKHQELHQKPLDLSDWREIIPNDIPKQTNGYDCGVFTCQFADYCAQDKKFDFKQSDMPNIRKKMILNLIEHKEKV